MGQAVSFENKLFRPPLKSYYKMFGYLNFSTIFMSILFLFLIHIQADQFNPGGESGCSGWRKDPGKSPGRCWRHCVGNSGDWCYTSYGCTTHANCTQQNLCAGISCVGAIDKGCVTTCERVQLGEVMNKLKANIKFIII
jgi:hypothetical protein